MNKQSKKILGLFSRYLTILLLGLGNLYIIYKILTPLTVNTLNLILSTFANPIVTNNAIILNNTMIKIVPACVAGSAFYLLLLLILSTENIKPKTRTKAIITALIAFFILNILRILILIPMISTQYFETAHWIFWHLISTIFVVGTWFAVVKIYKIKSIPICSDIKFIIHLTKNPKRKKKNK
ncbi:MAG: pacearchaeosortase [Nanoarchaeota archaeon]|nr:pacearchaeosortase [Nanoarchaeota archaeon]